eukprot:11175125-Lingulodinium_polyedra.AAC.1
MAGSKNPPARQLIGTLGVYVDCFLFVESDDPERKTLVQQSRVFTPGDTNTMTLHFVALTTAKHAIGTPRWINAN